MQDNAAADFGIGEFLPTAEAARVIGLAEQTLASDRVTHRLRIPFHKFGSAVRYRRSDLLNWAASCRQEVANG